MFKSILYFSLYRKSYITLFLDTKHDLYLIQLTTELSYGREIQLRKIVCN